MKKKLINKKRIYRGKIKILKRKKSLYIKKLLKIFLIIIILLFSMKKDYHEVHIALNIDNKYLYQSLVFITSLLENRNSTTIYDIHILATQNIISVHQDKSQILLKKYGDKYLNISYINMDNDFMGALTGPYISTAAYYRIALPSLLPYLDRIIYCDSDVINFKDLTEMYELKLDNNTYFKGMLDYSSMMNEMNFIDMPRDKYVNSGILLMNLKSMRMNNVEKKIRDFINKHFLNHHDQTAINGVCYNNWEVLSIKYACFNFDNYDGIVKYNNRQNKKYRYSEEEFKQVFMSQLSFILEDLKSHGISDVYVQKINIGGIMLKNLAYMKKF